MNNIKVGAKIAVYEVKREVLENIKAEQEERLRNEDSEYMRDILHSHLRVCEAKIEMTEEIIADLKSLL